MSNVLPLAKRVDVAAHLVEGCSVRTTSTLTGVNKTTVIRFLLLLGAGCARLHDRLVRGVVATDIEMDEIWGYVWKKQHRCNPGDPYEWGDNYTFVALARGSKLVISYLTGPRDGSSTFVFVHDIKQRIVVMPYRVQFTSDGFQPYIPAMRAAFGLRVNFGQVVKQYGRKQKDDHRYEPAREAEFIVKTPILGVPDFERMSTSMVERQNLTMRMQIRRLTRLTNAFSKKRKNLGAAISLHFAWYNFCRIHETIRCTPAMQAGLTDHVWDLRELVERALAEPEPPAAPLAPFPSPGRWTGPMQQLGLFDRAAVPPALPGLLPPSTGGTPSANDNDGGAPRLPALPGAGATLALPEAGAPEAQGSEGEAQESHEGEDEDEAPATEREPTPFGAAVGASTEWVTLQGGSFGVG